MLTAAAYAFSLFFREGSLFNGDGDVGRHIRVGTEILASRSIPRVDLFSHTMEGQPFIPYEWLSEVWFGGAHQLAGLAGVAVLTAALFAGAVGLVYVTMVRLGLPRILALIFGFVGLVMQAIHLLPRPHMFTTLFAAAFCLVLLEARRGAVRWLYALPPIMLVWANAHGGFLIGFILLFLFLGDAALRARRDPDCAAGRLLRGLVASGAICFGASLLTPAGWALWAHTIGYLRLEYLVDNTDEYRSPDFHDALIKSFLGALLFGTCVLAWLRSRVDMLGLACFVLFAAFALHSTRNIPIFAVVAVPWMALWTRDVLEQTEDSTESRGRRFLTWARELSRAEAGLMGWPVGLAVCLVLTFLALSPARAARYAFGDRFPVAAVDQLDRLGVEGRVYNEFTWGGYLLYAAWPDVPVFIDGQTDFYGVELVKDYDGIRYAQPGWKDLLARHRIDWMLVPPEAPISAVLAETSDWRRVYGDSTAFVYVRRDGE
jgi:hypothetical protein